MKYMLTPTCQPAPNLRYAPAPDPRTVIKWLVTIDCVDGDYIDVSTFRTSFKVRIPNTKDRPRLLVGKRYCLEYPKDTNPFSHTYTAFYAESTQLELSLGD